MRFGVFFKVKFLPAEAAFELFFTFFHLFTSAGRTGLCKSALLRGLDIDVVRMLLALRSSERRSDAIITIMALELNHLVVKPENEPGRYPLTMKLPHLPRPATWKASEAAIAASAQFPSRRTTV
jgi:hypothetical protein